MKDFANSCIVLCADKHSLDKCLIALKFFYKKNSPEICSYILVDELNRNSREFLRLKQDFKGVNIIWINSAIFEGVVYRKNRPLVKEAYFRLLIPEVLPVDIHRALYIDTDVMILRNIESLFSLDLGDNIIAAVPDISPFNIDHLKSLNLTRSDGYFCSGFMLMDLDRCRTELSTDRLLNWAKKSRIVYFHDQDVLNYFLKGRWLALNRDYNIFIPYTYHSTLNYDPDMNRAKSVHFYHYFKPWNRFCTIDMYLLKYLKLWRKEYKDTMGIKQFEGYLVKGFEVSRWQMSVVLWRLSWRLGITNFLEMVIKIKNVLYGKV